MAQSPADLTVDLVCWCCSSGGGVASGWWQCEGEAWVWFWMRTPRLLRTRGRCGAGQRQCAAWRHAARTRHTRHVTASLRPARDTWHGPAGYTQVTSTSTESVGSEGNHCIITRDAWFDVWLSLSQICIVYLSISYLWKWLSRKREDMNLVVVLQSCFPEIVNCEYQNCEDNIHPSISTVHEVLCLVLCRSWKQIILIPGYASARVEAPALILWSWNFGHLARDSNVKDYQQLLIRRRPATIFASSQSSLATVWESKLGI